MLITKDKKLISKIKIMGKQSTLLSGMYYNRTVSKSLADLLSFGGQLRWLYDFVKEQPDLDFLLYKNNTSEGISVYRGLSRILTIREHAGNLILSAAPSYVAFNKPLYGVKNLNTNFQADLELVIKQVRANVNPKLARYYNCQKEGYYQSAFSRNFGICGAPDSDFVLIDKESVIGYLDSNYKTQLLTKSIINKYKQLQSTISSINPKLYGNNLVKKSLGNELDFLALDKNGNILLIEFKHGENTSGIYLSPLQIGIYHEIFTSYPWQDLQNAVFSMLEQKQKIGLINPAWQKPKTINQIIPILIISDCPCLSNGSSKARFNEILKIAKQHLGANFLSNLETKKYQPKSTLINW